MSPPFWEQVQGEQVAGMGLATPPGFFYGNNQLGPG